MGMIRIAYVVTAAALLHGCATSLSHKEASVGGSADASHRSGQHASADGEPSYQPNGPELHPNGDLLDYLRENMKWPSHSHRKQVQNMIRFYARKPEYLERSLERGERYLHYMVTELERRNMPLELALLPMVESAYRPYAKSPKLAAGLWQFIPGTGKRYNLNMDYWHDQRYDPIEATKAALRYLHDLANMHKKYDDKWFLALASYNWGENNVKRKLRQNKAAGKKRDFWNIRKPRETANYVPSLLAMVEIIKNPGKHGVDLPEVADTPYFEVVRVRRPIDLGIAAELAGMSMEELYQLNGSLKRWLRPPQAPARLLIPVAKAGAFREKLEQLDDEQWLKVKKHTVRKGESALSIAANHGIDVTLLKAVNPYLRVRSLQPGEVLDIPQPKFKRSHYAVRGSGGGIRPASGERLVHTVRSGESLWLIARKYGTTVNSIKRWNNRSSNLLRPGQKLIVWGGNKGGKGGAKASPGGSYAVRKGDTLSEIAERHGVGLSSLARANNMTNANKNKLRVGQRLLIPGGKRQNAATAQGSIDYTVKHGDSLWSIAKRHNVSISSLLAWNSMSSPPRFLQPGQLLRILRP